MRSTGQHHPGALEGGTDALRRRKHGERQAPRSEAALCADDGLDEGDVSLLDTGTVNLDTRT